MTTTLTHETGATNGHTPEYVPFEASPLADLEYDAPEVSSQHKKEVGPEIVESINYLRQFIPALPDSVQDDDLRKVFDKALGMGNNQEAHDTNRTSLSDIDFDYYEPTELTAHIMKLHDNDPDKLRLIKLEYGLALNEHYTKDGQTPPSTHDPKAQLAMALMIAQGRRGESPAESGGPYRYPHDIPKRIISSDRASAEEVLKKREFTLSSSIQLIYEVNRLIREAYKAALSVETSHRITSAELAKRALDASDLQME